MKHGPITKLVTRNTETSKKKKKKIDDDVMLINCDVIVIFLIYGQSGAIRKPD